MRKIGMAFGLVAIVSAFGISAAAASAHRFESSGGATRGKQIGNEEFVVWPMKVTCRTSASKGFAPAGSFGSYTTETKYAGCTTFTGTVKVGVSPALWEYNAEDTESLLNEVTIKPNNLSCHYTIPPQSAFTKQSIIYGDEKLPASTAFPTGQLKLNIYSSLKGVAYTAFGWPCTGPKTAEALKEEKAESSEGEGGAFTGANHEEVVSGNLTWIE
jgi:hypothetical protein